MPHRTRILHDEDEFLIAEQGGDPVHPSLLVFVRSDNPRFRLDTSLPEYSTEQGSWCLVARFDGKELDIPHPGNVQHRGVLQLLVQSFLSERAERNRKAENPCFFISAEGRPLSELIRAQPGGLVIRMFRQREDAEKALQELGVPGSVESTGVLRDFLALRAEEGFAGAILDDEEPVYWCLDEESNIQFLKLRTVPGTSEIEEHLLDARGLWQVYEGDESLTLLEDQDAWDELMERVLGPVPYLGYTGSPALYTFLDAGEPVYLEDESEETARMLPLFQDRDGAQRFLDEHEMHEIEIVEIEDLKEAVHRAGESGAVARLHPGDHRARGGSLWLDGDRLILDSFSGFWGSDNGVDYARC